MTSEARGATVTILFTDLVNSTELLQRAGDEQAQRVFQAHHRLLRDAVAASGGHEVKWLGDGLMVAFPSAADAVRCAIAVQQASRRPAAAGERLEVRVGLNVGDALREEADYFGTPVVVAKRLCDAAEAGQIVCSSLVAGLLAGRQAFRFRELDELEFKGIAQPVAACEVLYERDEPAALLAHTPFIGRKAEVTRLRAKLQEARSGQGGLVMLVGEPGIGKTRTSEEFCEAARQDGCAVAWGRCYEGEWAPPYGPFAEAIEEYARSAEPEALREDLGLGAGPVARLVSSLRERLPDIPEPVPLQPDEERFRLLDAVSQFFIAASQRAPVVLVLDDLHWADKGTIAMLRHVARFAPRHRILLLGAYRDVELDRQHPLADALGALHRETNYERVVLKGLDKQAIGELLSTIAEQEAPQPLVDAISSETDGNPFFIREVLLHLVDTGALYRKDGVWTSDAASIEELGIPEGVRQVIGRRLSRLSEHANRLLTAASAFSSAFSFDIVRNVAGLEEPPALDAVDETLDAQLLQPGQGADHYQFTHALIRHTLYGELNPSRQVRLHRQIAEAMERRDTERYGDTPQAVSEHAAELAYQYHRSAALPGAERGVGYAIAAADHAEAAFARDETVTFLRMALDLLPPGDPRRPRLLARVGMALAWTLEFDEALKAASEAGDLIAATEGHDAAADFLAEAMEALWGAGFQRGAWALAGQGLRYVGDRRDQTWAWLASSDVDRREAEDPDNPGIPLDTPERREIEKIVHELPLEERRSFLSYFESREDILARFPDAAPVVAFYAGDYRRGLALFEQAAAQAEQEGRLAWAVADWAQVARMHNALGNLEAAQQAYERGMSLAARLAGPSLQALQLVAARWEMRSARGEIQEALEELEALLGQPALENQWASAAIRAAGAALYAWIGRSEDALRWLGTLLPAIERAPLWAPNYPLLPCLAAYALWQLDRTDHIDVIERNLRNKVVAPDLRYPMRDSRLSMAQLCALQGRYDEAVEWFQKARDVLDEQGARPLRAIVDFDEALMYLRRAAPGDNERAKPLVAAALRQFREIGMTGWVRRAEELAQS
jgi:class 3 adenylate cyclase/tetratricopeptide (TPR) repeat protein